jgi:hypothetical protein
VAACFVPMDHQHTIETALRRSQEVLWDNLPPQDHLPDDLALRRLREIIRSPDVSDGLERGSDTFLAFVLRAVRLVLSDRSQRDRDAISRLWAILDDPALNTALGIVQNSRMKIGRGKPRMPGL